MSGGVVLTEAEREAIRIAISADLVPVVPTPSVEWIGWWLTQDRPRKTPGVIERLITRRLAVQAGRVAEVVEKVLARDRCRDVHETTYTDPWCESCRSWARHVTARVAAELEADQ